MNRTRAVMIRLTDLEYARLEAAHQASPEHWARLAEWVRRRLLSALPLQAAKRMMAGVPKKKGGRK